MSALPRDIKLNIPSRQPVRRHGRGARARQAAFVPKLLPPWSDLEYQPKAALPATGANRPLRSGLARDGNRSIRVYLREVGRVEALTSQQEERLVLQVKNGSRKARERLIKASLRRVVEISRDFENMGLSLLDLISEGNVGLLKAIERFEPSNRMTFSAASTWWIRQSIKRALAVGPKPFSQEPGFAAGRLPIDL